MSRRLSYLTIAALLATGAPLGLIALRAWQARGFSSSWLQAEWARDAPIYVYVGVSTLLVFAAFGYALGAQADRLYDLSSRDPLTALRNRRGLEERLGDELRRFARYGTPASLLLLDVDGLKAINDRDGHRAGDAALRRVARAIVAGSRGTDVAGRWGGDEFALVAASTGAAEARQLAERIRGLVASGGEAGETAVTVSVGVTTADPGSASCEALVRRADAALYEAKHRGRNRVVVA